VFGDFSEGIPKHLIRGAVAAHDDQTCVPQESEEVGMIGSPGDCDANTTRKGAVMTETLVKTERHEAIDPGFNARRVVNAVLGNRQDGHVDGREEAVFGG
jgi:hypothetical protein